MLIICGAEDITILLKSGKRANGSITSGDSTSMASWDLEITTSTTTFRKINF